MIGADRDHEDELGERSHMMQDQQRAMPMFTSLDRFGLIGDSGTAALVSPEGSIDWLCLPDFDSDPVFGKILDPEAGHFSIRPTEPFSVQRWYEPNTAVLATRFSTASGTAVLHDFFAVRTGGEAARSLRPFRQLVRRIVGEAGTVEFRMEFEPRPAFGGDPFRLAPSAGGVLARSRGRALFLQSQAPLAVDDGRAHALMNAGVGQSLHVVLAYAERDIGVVPSVGKAAETAYAETIDYWRNWAGPGLEDVPLPEMVARSTLTLKLLTFSPSGGVVAAPTTSLPESIGGERNWDYRFVWVRDASRAIIALSDHGHRQEARAYLSWILNAASLTQPRVRTLYDIYGRYRAAETTIAPLAGYLNSRPVRKGNAAAGQLQLDNWGYLVDAAWMVARRMGGLDRSTWGSIRSYVDFIAANWHLRDHGIWEVREQPQHFVHSKVMCWVALDRGIRIAETLGSPTSIAWWRRERDRVRASVMRDGFDSSTGTFVRSYGDSRVDAALLEIPLVGFLEGTDIRVQRTVDRIGSELGDAAGLVRRYRGEDGLEGEEGAFLPCSFWLAHAFALGGRHEEALKLFTKACSYSNDLGLLPEEIDPVSMGALGNFPQGLTHIALINAACAMRSSGQPRGA
jgi:GH15 family glucan-1,4-alpha-glucosidase